MRAVEEFVLQTRGAQPPDEIFPVFGEAAFVASLAPRMMGLHVDRIGMALGDEIEVHFSGLGPRGPWVSRIVELVRTGDDIAFVDRSVRLPWPFATFEHHHGFRHDGNGTTLIDDVRFTTSPALLGPLLRLVLRRSFAYRQPIYRRRFGAADANAAPPPSAS